ncbi:MAG: efflux RND transporter periplasmic adaptor subunit [Terriglobales bacterium]
MAVTVARATTENVPTNLQAIGSVQAINTVSVKTLVGGQLDSVDFHQGDEVHSGQVLFQIDPQPFQAALAQAQANLARDLATDKLDQAEARRYSDLGKQGIVSAEQVEQMVSTAAAADALVKADEAAVQSAKLQLSYCTIASPIDGRTGNLLVQAGNTVQPNSSILVTINQIKPIYVAFSVPEQYLQQIKQLEARHPLEVQAHAQGDNDLEDGNLSFINNAIDTTTGTIQLMATFSNPHEKLWPGEYVNTNLTLEVLQNATVVPASAVQTGENNNLYVYVLDANNTVENQTVTTSTTWNGETVITHGVEPGQTVVTDGQLGLFPGAKVSIKPGGGVAAGPEANAER